MSAAMLILRALHTALVLSAAGLAGAAWAASVQVQVQDAAGQPLGDAVVFLESVEVDGEHVPRFALVQAEPDRFSRS